MADLIAVRPGQALFDLGDEHGVIVDAVSLNADAPQPLTLLTASGGWTRPARTPSNLKTLRELAAAAGRITASADAPRAIEHSTTSSSFRAPRAVSDEARRGLDWYHQFGDGSITTTAVDTARLLASGAPLDSQRVLEAVRGLETHGGRLSVAERLLTTNRPSSDRITWSLFGGMAGERWLRNVAEQLATKDSEAPVAEDEWPETDWVDVDKPHEFMPSADDELCMLCQLPADDDVHTDTTGEASMFEFSSAADVTAALEQYLAMPRGSKKRRRARRGITQCAYASELQAALPSVWKYRRVSGEPSGEFGVDAWAHVLNDGDYFTEVIDEFEDGSGYEERPALVVVSGLLHRDVSTASWRRFDAQSRTWAACDEPDHTKMLVIVDDDVASEILENILSTGRDQPMELAVDESALYTAAESQLDHELYDLIVTHFGLDDDPITAAVDTSNTVVVALPSVDDPINGVSSESGAHMTMLFFGPSEDIDLDGIRAAVVNAAASLNGPVTATVTGREVLGDESADVLKLDPAELLPVREALAQDPAVADALSQVKQYPQWTPHLTLGYPETPANGDPASDTITFDRLAIWTGDYDGEEYAFGSAPMTAAGDGYTPIERATNARRQVRDPGGKFTKPGSSVGPSKSSAPAPKSASPRKATLPTPLPVVDDIGTLIDAYLADAEKKRKGGGAVPLQAAGVPPEASEVPPLYLAVVDPNDTKAVLDLVALVPAQAPGGEPSAWLRKDGAWVEDIAMLRDMRGSTPPPVVQLDAETTTLITEQVDASTAEKKPEQPAAVEQLAPLWGPKGELLLLSVVAAGVPGVADTPSDEAAAERLRRYWTVGPGGAKIRWNTPGDWTRCYRQLKKHMGVRAKGYCSLRHHEMTGTWPGDKKNVGVRGSGLIVDARFAAVAEDVGAPEVTNVSQVPESGQPFLIPLVVPEEVESGDGRKFKTGALSLRDLPLPLLWQPNTQAGHDESVIVGRMDSVEVLPGGGLGNARGVFDTGPYAQEAVRLIKNKMLRGVSADLDALEAELVVETLSDDEEDGKDGERIGSDKMLITQARLMAATIVAKPAFQECRIELVSEEDHMIPDGEYGETLSVVDAEALTACAAILAAAPVEPPTSWFHDPQLGEPTHLSVTDDGRVYGHIAAWHVDHIGLPFGTRPPRSASGYAYFRTGIVRTAEGSDVPVGQLTLAGGHAPLSATAAEAVRHYDDTASAIADVAAGEDRHGIWVAGALRPNVTPEQVRSFRASSPSGDWRPIKGKLELVAVCQVNVPGFPVVRARVASGRVMALVAAGASTLAHLRSDPDVTLYSRIEALEAADRSRLTAAAEALSARVSVVSMMHDAELTARVEDARVRVAAYYDNGESTFADVSAEKREEYAKKGVAMKDGSYPIPDVAHLRKAIQAYGRAKNKAGTRRHIIKRARALGKTKLVPESWSKFSAEDTAALHAELSAHVVELRAAPLHVKPEWDESLHPRTDEGKFRSVLARLDELIGGENDSSKDEVIQAVSDAADAEASGDTEAADNMARDASDMLARLEDVATPGAAADALAEAKRSVDEAIGTAKSPAPAEGGKLPAPIQELLDKVIEELEQAADPGVGAVLSRLKKLVSPDSLATPQEVVNELLRILKMQLIPNEVR